MKISNIRLYQTNNQSVNNKNAQVKTNQFAPKLNYASYPLTNQYLSFLGGYSVNLKETYEHLKTSEYPLDVKSGVEFELKQNENTLKTLYDIHFDKYKGILDCYSLDELKENYPEFQSVICADDVFAKENSFIGKYQAGQSEIFSSDEDLTLQLIKLYWGKGFSLSDLSNYIQKNSNNGEGINLYYTMQKLNIPLLNKRYASVLKLSDKEYNEKFTQTMSEKRKEALEARIQRQEGEPVIIPKGKLSDSHKKHISEGLIKYYKEHPEAIANQTKRQKEFYENNPEFKEQLSRVSDFAWNKTKEGKSVKKYLSKFLKKFGSVNVDKITSGSDLSSKETSALEEFWKRNGWAREKFSTAMTKGWESVSNCGLTSLEKFFDGKSEKEVKVSFATVPSELDKKIRNWAKNNNEYTPKHPIGLGIVVSDKVKVMPEVYEELFKINNVLEKFSDENPKELSSLANARQLALTALKKDLEEESPELPAFIRENPLKRYTLNYFLETVFIDTPIYEERGPFKKMQIEGVSNPLLGDIIRRLMKEALDLGCTELGTYFSNKLDLMYYYVSNPSNQKVMSNLTKIFV